MRRLRTFVNKIVDRKTKKVIKRLSDDLQKSRAEATLEKAGRQQALQALRHEKTKRKRGKKLIEQFRAEEGSGSILFSPGKVRAALELQDRREQEKEREREEKVQRAQEKALAKVRKEQEVQKRRNDRAIAQAARKAARALQTAQREADKAARKAQKLADTELKTSEQEAKGKTKEVKGTRRARTRRARYKCATGRRTAPIAVGETYSCASAPVGLKICEVIVDASKSL